MHPPCTCYAIAGGGESFGLSVAEFAVMGKPVLTSSEHTDKGSARFHIDTLGDRAMLYRDEASLRSILIKFDRQAAATRAAWYAHPRFSAIRMHSIVCTHNSTDIATCTHNSTDIRECTIICRPRVSAWLRCPQVRRPL